MRVIDAHMHVNLGGYDAAAIIQSMDRQGIDQSWLLTWEEIHPPVMGIYEELPAEQVLQAYIAYPARFVPFYAPDPSTIRLEETLEQMLKQGFRGCGELKVSLKWEDNKMETYLQLIEKHNLPLVFHMEEPRQQYVSAANGFFEWLLERLLNDKYNGVSRYYITRFAERTGMLKNRIGRNQVHFPGILYDFAALENRIRQFPGIPFIGHGPEFWNHISNHRHPRYIHQKGTIKEFGIIDTLMEQYDNLYCDISGTSGFNAMNRDHKQTRQFLQKHAHKILFGTDNTRFPLLDLLHSMKLEKEKMDQILHRNAMKVLG